MQTQTHFRLLVVRLGAMGDILHALPAITALRRAHPSWIIDWVVEPRWQALLTAGPAALSELTPAQPLVNQLHFAQIRQWRRQPFSPKTIKEIGALRAQLRGCGYDAVLDLQGAIRSAVVARLAGCRRIVGEAAPRERPARLLFSETVSTRGAHVIQQDIELASAIAGDDLQHMLPALPFHPEAESWAQSLFPPAAAPSVLINPGAGWGAKCWPIERYASVANRLAAQGFRIFVNAGPGEEPLADALHQATGGAAITLDSSLASSLARLIALTRRVTFVLAGDTGPLHLACALGRPVVGVYGPTDPSRNGPFGVRFRVLRSPLSRRDHTRHAAPEAGLLTIQPGDVLAAIAELLAPETHK